MAQLLRYGLTRMMTPVVMPQLGLEVVEGTVVALHVDPGAAVRRGDTLVELSTDKADTDVEAPADGYVHSIEVELGDTVEVGAVLLHLSDSPGESGVPEPTGEPPRLRAAPVARRAAMKLDVPLDEIEGTGPRGRITLSDVERHAAARAERSPPRAPDPAPPSAHSEPLTGIRRAIARRMADSQRNIPQYRLERDVDMRPVLDQTQRIRTGGTRVSVNDLLVQAIATMVTRHPRLATVFVDGDEPSSERRAGVNVGLAVATDAGLLVPVIRDAHEATLSGIAAQRTRLVEAARAGTIDLRDLSGGTITLSSLAASGVDRFTALVNPGESAIVAVGRTQERLVPSSGGIALVPMATFTLSPDHRIVDGATGAAALAELAQLLEGGMEWRA